MKKNILASYASQLYVTGVSLVVVPLYLRHMGAEAYGLVGFFTMLQAWFNLLDMGLTPTMARETARFHGGAVDALDYRRLTRALEGIFLLVAVVGGLLLFASAGWLASHWLTASHLPSGQVTACLRLMAVIIALRWMCGLYRGAISGAERLVWLGGFNAGIATLRFVLILPFLIYVSASPLAFFRFQLAVAVLELTGLAGMAYRLWPAVPAGQKIRWEWAPLRPVLKFSLTIAFLSSVWVLLTQTDKLVLSKILPLADYAYFTVAVLVAAGIGILSNPISAVLLPRLTRLQAEGDEAQLIALYRQATRLIAAIAIPAALVLAFFASEVLWAWTGDRQLAQKAAPVLALYAAGYGILAVAAFPYYLQYAKGDLKLHWRGNILFALILIPSIIIAATHYGMVGAGWAWLLSNASFLLLWCPLVHQRFAPGLHRHWLFLDVALPAAVAFFTVCGPLLWLPLSQQRLLLTAQLLAVASLGVVVSHLVAGLFATRWPSKFSVYSRNK